IKEARATGGYRRGPAGSGVWRGGRGGRGCVGGSPAAPAPPPGRGRAGTSRGPGGADATPNAMADAPAPAGRAPPRAAAAAPAGAGAGGAGPGAAGGTAAGPPMLPWKPGRFAAMACCRVIASSAVPSEPAMRWMVPIVAVAAPMAGRSMDWNAAAMDGVIVAPIPAPMSSSATARYQYAVVAVIWV